MVITFKLWVYVMLLMPQKDWQWQYNASKGVLSVSLGVEMEFLTPYTLKCLIPDAQKELVFDLEHVKYYIELVDKLSKALFLSDAGIVQIALNATAAHFLLKPQMPKSWFFEVSNTCVFSEVGKVFELQTETKRVKVLVIEVSLQSSLVMLLSQECQLTPTKKMQCFDVIKVMHDRLLPLTIKHRDCHIVAA